MSPPRKLNIQLFSERRRIWRFWVPDGLHLWWGGRGIHLWLFGRCHVMHEYDCEWDKCRKERHVVQQRLLGGFLRSGVTHTRRH